MQPSLPGVIFKFFLKYFDGYFFHFQKKKIFLKNPFYFWKIGAKQLGSIVAAAKAQALAEQIGVDESRRSFARLVKTNKRNKNKTKKLG